LVASREVTMRMLALAGALLLALGEVAAGVLDVEVAALLALGEVTAMMGVGSLLVGLLAGREAAVLVVAVLVVAVLVVAVVIMVMTVTAIVVGMLAHARVSQRWMDRHCGPVVKLSVLVSAPGLLRRMSRMLTWSTGTPRRHRSGGG
jgi:hypothetical protein